MRFLAITAGGDFHPAPRTIVAGTNSPTTGYYLQHQFAGATIFYPTAEFAAK
jgi:hypothetical protein